MKDVLTWKQALEAGKNPHQQLFNKDPNRPKPRFLDDPLTKEQRQRIEDIKWLQSNPQDDLKEVWE